MWRNGHERTRVDTHCDPALAADISNVNDGYFHHFVTVRPSAPSLADRPGGSHLVHPFALSSPPGGSHLVHPFALTSPPGGRPSKASRPRTSYFALRAHRFLRRTLARLRPLRYHP